MAFTFFRVNTKNGKSQLIEILHQRNKHKQLNLEIV